MTSEHAYPMMISLRGKLCVVVGGGAVAERKSRALLACGARVRIIAPEMRDSIRSLESESCELIQARYSGAEQMRGARIVVAASDDIETNRTVVEDACAIGAFVNCATEPEIGDFIVPASFTDRSITVAVSCDGLPAWSRLLRDRLRRAIGDGAAEFADFLRGVRAEVRAAIADSRERTDIWRRVLNGEIADLVGEGRIDEAKERIRDAIGRIGPES